MLLDNIIIFFNVLEQFAIRVSIFDFNVEDLIKYVNKLYFNNDDNFIENFIGQKLNDCTKNFDYYNPECIVQETIERADADLLRKTNFAKLVFCKDILYIY